MKQRNAYFDFLRGVAILMVIAIHTFPKCGFDSVEGCLQIFIRQIVGCPVPLFLAISGYFLGKKKLDGKQERMTFWKRQIPKVYIPALIWSLFYYILSVKGGSNPFLSFAILVGMGYSIYYFIALIIQCYLLLPILQKVNSKRMGVILAVSILSGVIYLIHFIVLNIMNRVVTIDIWFMTWAFATAISVAIIMFSRRYLPDTINKYIGFE